MFSEFFVHCKYIIFESSDESWVHIFIFRPITTIYMCAKRESDLEIRDVALLALSFKWSEVISCTEHYGSLLFLPARAIFLQESTEELWHAVLTFKRCPQKGIFPDVLKIFPISSSAARQTILDNRMSTHMNYFPYCARSRNCDVSSKRRRQKMSTQRSSVQISSCHKTRWKRNCINHWKAWKFNVSSAVFLAFLFL